MSDARRIMRDAPEMLADLFDTIASAAAERGMNQEDADALALAVVALGQAAIYNLGTGLLRLTGDPVLKTAEGELRGREVLFDQRTKRLKAAGRWKMTLNPKTIAKMRGRKNRMK